MNRRTLLTVLLLLSLPFFFDSSAYSQSVKNPDRDLLVSFARERETTEFGAVSGQVTNRSINVYPCVRLEFNLYGPDQGTSGGRRLGGISVEVLDVRPRSVRRYSQPLPYPAETIAHKSVSECDQQGPGQSVVIYDNPNFEGRSRSFDIGSHRLFTPADFNDVASSIQVPPNLAVVVYEHADEGGGYGMSVDFLEDQPDLTPYDLNNKISYLVVFNRERPGFFYARNRIQNREFVAGHWEGARAGGNPLNPNPVVAPPKPPNIPPVTTTPPAPGFCTISGSIRSNKSTYGTTIELYRDDGSRSLVRRITTHGEPFYRFPRVTEGRYLLIPKGRFPTGSGKMGGLAAFPLTERVLCEPDRSHRVDFAIRSTEG